MNRNVRLTSRVAPTGIKCQRPQTRAGLITLRNTPYKAGYTALDWVGARVYEECDPLGPASPGATPFQAPTSIAPGALACADAAGVRGPD